MRRAHRLGSPFLLAALALFGLACGFGGYRPDDPMSKGNSLEESHRAYSSYVRWSKFDEAASYVVGDKRGPFLAEMPDFDSGRFSDWKANAWELQELKDRTSAVIEVTYEAYSLNNPVLFKVKEKQNWSRTDPDQPWRVDPEFTGLEQFGSP